MPKNIHLYILFALGLAGCLFADTSLFVDGGVRSKRYCFFLFTVVFLLCTAIRRLGPHKKPFITLSGTTIGIICFMMAFMESAFSLGNNHGSLDNNAGLAICLCAAWPFGKLIFASSRLKWQKAASLAIWAFVAVNIVLSESRTGIFSLIVCSLLLIIGSFHLKKHIAIIVSIVLLVIVLWGLYQIRPDSANGRILVWKCSLEMIDQKPLFGHGKGGFMAHYMNYQAHWLASRPEYSYADLADNIKTPFNEWIKILCEYGFAGFVLSLAVVAGLFRRWRKQSDQTDCSCAGLSLVAIMCCSLFSYPFSYPFIWTIVLVDIWILLKDSHLTHYKYFRYLSSVCSLTFALLVSFELTKDIPAQIEWKRLTDSSPFENSEQAFKQYDKLIKKLGSNPYFLYNYSAELYDDARWKDCLKIAEQCCELWSDYDLEMLMGDAYFNLGDYPNAESHYGLSAQMCPCRFFPLYDLMEIYRKQKRWEEYEAMAKQILNKPIKVHSEDVERIKIQAEKYWQVLILENY